MTNKKLTDNEIIKALECCYTAGNPCENCPLCDVEECNDVLMAEYVKDLINRLQDKNKAYKYYYDECLKDLKKANTENERLKGHQKDGFFNLLGNCLVFSKTLKDYNDMRKGLKSEAVKDFAERLKEEYAQGINWFGVKEHYFVNVEDIDNLVKEMMGENNEI